MIHLLKSFLSWKKIPLFQNCSHDEHLLLTPFHTTLISSSLSSLINPFLNISLLYVCSFLYLPPVWSIVCRLLFACRPSICCEVSPYFSLSPLVSVLFCASISYHCTWVRGQPISSLLLPPRCPQLSFYVSLWYSKHVPFRLFRPVIQIYLDSCFFICS